MSVYHVNSELKNHTEIFYQDSVVKSTMSLEVSYCCEGIYFYITSTKLFDQWLRKHKLTILIELGENMSLVLLVLRGIKNVSKTPNDGIRTVC